MSLKTDDEDIRDVRLFMEVGGNGDYYINLMDMDKKVRLDCRIAMSGGNAPHEVKMAVAGLYRALAKADLQHHPLEDKAREKVFTKRELINEPPPQLNKHDVTGWQELDLVQPDIGQKIVYEGNLYATDGVYVGKDEVRLADGTIDWFDRWKPA